MSPRRDRIVAVTAAGGLVVGSLTAGFGSTAISALPSPSRVAMVSETTLTAEQRESAAQIISTARTQGADDDAVVIALMTAAQESSLRNLDHGDKDSLGYYQQRPSWGWGTPEQVRDEEWATSAFLGTNPEVDNPGLFDIADWREMSPNDAAQAVQRSNHPDEYAKWEELARALVDSHDAGMTGGLG